MKRIAATLFVFLTAAFVGHWFVLSQAPAFIMDRALAGLGERGVALHSFSQSPRMTPQTQTVVRPAPDLAYSLCRYDFSAGISALEVRMNSYRDYQSLSFFDDRTNNFATLRGEGEGVSVILTPPGTSSAENTLVSPSERGVILIRRLAPSEAAYAAASEQATGDHCKAISQS